MGIDHLMTVFRITNLEGVTWTFKTNFEPKEFVKITNE